MSAALVTPRSPRSLARARGRSRILSARSLPPDAPAGASNGGGHTLRARRLIAEDASAARRRAYPLPDERPPRI